MCRPLKCLPKCDKRGEVARRPITPQETPESLFPQQNVNPHYTMNISGIVIRNTQFALGAGPLCEEQKNSDKRQRFAHVHYFSFIMQSEYISNTGSTITH